MIYLFHCIILSPLVIMGTQLRALLKPLDTIVLWCSRGCNWFHMIPTDARHSNDAWSFFRSFCRSFFLKIFSKLFLWWKNHAKKRTSVSWRIEQNPIVFTIFCFHLNQTEFRLQVLNRSEICWDSRILFNLTIKTCLFLYVNIYHCLIN